MQMSKPEPTDVSPRGFSPHGTVFRAAISAPRGVSSDNKQEGVYPVMAKESVWTKLETQGRRGVLRRALQRHQGMERTAREEAKALEKQQKKEAAIAAYREKRDLTVADFFRIADLPLPDDFADIAESHHQRFHRRPAQTDAGFDLFILGGNPRSLPVIRHRCCRWPLAAAVCV